MPKRIGMTLSIGNNKKIYICIVVAQDFQVSNSGSLLITGIISPVGVLVTFMKDMTTLCLMIVMANFDDTLSITKL
jgi:hypothetical protein